jgi:hypothetical protein
MSKLTLISLCGLRLFNIKWPHAPNLWFETLSELFTIPTMFSKPWLRIKWNKALLLGQNQLNLLSRRFEQTLLRTSLYNDLELLINQIRDISGNQIDCENNDFGLSDNSYQLRIIDSNLLTERTYEHKRYWER